MRVSLLLLFVGVFLLGGCAPSLSHDSSGITAKDASAASVDGAVSDGATVADANMDSASFDHLAPGDSSDSADRAVTDAQRSDVLTGDTQRSDVLTGDAQRSDIQKGDIQRGDAPTGDARVFDRQGADGQMVHDGSSAADGSLPLQDAGAGQDTAPNTGYNPAELIGSIEVRENVHMGFRWGEVNAFINDLPTVDIAPEAYFGLVEDDGRCQLWEAGHRGDIPLCEPECRPDQFCTPSLTCAPQPNVLSAGDLAIGGLSRAIVLSPRTWGYTSETFDDGEVFADDATITVTAVGDALETFVLQTSGVSDLAIGHSGPLNIRDNQSLTVNWTAAGSQARVEVFVTPWVHIFTFMFIRCQTEDTGSLEIPWSMLQHFPYDDQCGHGECASDSYIIRYREDHTTTTQGVVRLRVGSQTRLNVNKPRE